MAYMIPPMYNTEQPVGAPDPNRPDDVKLIQAMLNELAKVTPGWAPAGTLPVNGTFDPNMGAWISAFQSHLKRKGSPMVVDSRVHSMPIQAGLDIKSRFRSGVGSTLYALNFNLFRSAPDVHTGLGRRLGIRPREV